MARRESAVRAASKDARATTFHANFNAALDRSGKSLSQISRETNIALSMLSRWRTHAEKSKIRDDHLERLALALGFRAETIWEPSGVVFTRAPGERDSYTPLNLGELMGRAAAMFGSASPEGAWFRETVARVYGRCGATEIEDANSLPGQIRMFHAAITSAGWSSWIEKALMLAEPPPPPAPSPPVKHETPPATRKRS